MCDGFMVVEFVGGGPLDGERRFLPFTSQWYQGYKYDWVLSCMLWSRE